MALLLVPLLVGGLVGPRPLGVFTAEQGGIKRTTAPASTPSMLPEGPAAAAVKIDPETGKSTGGDGSVVTEPNDQGTSRQVPVGRPPSSFAPLTGNPARITVYDYIERAYYGAADTLKNHTLVLEGFASRDPDNPSGPWVLARLKMWCCAADALPYMITAVDGPAVEYGQWVRLVGTWLPSTKAGDARIKVVRVEPIPDPKDPYLW